MLNGILILALTPKEANCNEMSFVAPMPRIKCYEEPG